MRTRLFYLLGLTMALAMVVLTPMVTQMLAQDPANTAKKSAPLSRTKNVPKSASGGELSGLGIASGGLSGGTTSGEMGPRAAGSGMSAGSTFKGRGGGMHSGFGGSGGGMTGMLGGGGSSMGGMPGGVGGGMPGMTGGGGSMSGGSGAMAGMGGMPGMGEDAELELEVENLTAMYAETEEAEAREQLRTQIAGVLEQIFDARHQRRLQELEVLESRVSKFRGIIEARQAQKSEIIKGRLDTIVREADGLGWGDGATRQPGR